MIALLLGLILSEEPNPVILLPGLYGSQLYGTHQGFARHWYCSKNMDDELLWVDAKFVIPPLYNCLFEMLAGYYDNGTIKSQPGLDVHAHDFGGTSGLENIIEIGFLKVMDSFEPMVDFLVSKGYIVGKNLFGAPYDWRIALPGLITSNFFNDLEGLIVTAFEKSGGKKVSLMGYSLGGMVISHYLGRMCNDSFLDKYISRAIFVAPAFGGAGETLPVAWDLLFPIVPFISNDIITNTLMNMPVVHCLFPNHVVFKDVPIVIRPDGSIVYAENLIDFLVEQNKLTGDAIKLARLNEEYSKKPPADPKVPSVIIYNANISTALAISFVKGYDESYETQYVLGDGTVPQHGPEWACRNWNKEHKHALECYNLERTEDEFNHAGIGTNNFVHDKINYYVNNDDWMLDTKSRIVFAPWVENSNTSNYRLLSNKRQERKVYV